CDTLRSPPAVSPLSRSRAPPHLHSFPTRRSSDLVDHLAVDGDGADPLGEGIVVGGDDPRCVLDLGGARAELLVQDLDLARVDDRSEEHTSELQSRFDLVCRLLLEKKKI